MKHGAFVTTAYCLKITDLECNRKACHFNGWRLAPLFHETVESLWVLIVRIMCSTNALVYNPFEVFR